MPLAFVKTLIMEITTKTTGRLLVTVYADDHAVWDDANGDLQRAPFRVLLRDATSGLVLQQNPNEADILLAEHSYLQKRLREEIGAMHAIKEVRG